MQKNNQFLEPLLHQEDSSLYSYDTPPLSSYNDLFDHSLNDADYPYGQAYSVDDETIRLKEARKAERHKINSEIKKTAFTVKNDDKAVGFQAKKASKNGFKSERLPDHTKILLAQAKLLPYRDEFLVNDDGLGRAKTQKRSQETISYMLSALVVNCNVNNGMIVVAERKGGQNVTHDALRMEVAKRHGVFIAESTWYFYFSRLVECGYIKSHTVSVYEDGHIASFHAEASYKLLTTKLMNMLGADRKTVKMSAAKHEAKLKLHGKSYKQKPRFPSSRYKQDGFLRKNVTRVEPTQELLDLIHSYYKRESYYAPPN
ncbi:hypothetical protein [Shewanella frigidimarina]|uniref:hypothetical protein n=1 Tax=Shewanella frigidimarina TaxID=56812 RepID=UPI003D7ABAB3